MDLDVVLGRDWLDGWTQHRYISYISDKLLLYGRWLQNKTHLII